MVTNTEEPKKPQEQQLVGVFVTPSKAKKYAKKRDKEEEQEQREQEQIIKPQYDAKLSGNLTALISQGFDDNKQLTLWNNDKGVAYYGEQYLYKDKNTNLKAIYRQKEDYLTPIKSLTDATIKQFERLVNDKVILAKDIDIFTKKMFHLLHVYAFNKWHDLGYTSENIGNILAKDLIIEIPKKDIEAIFSVSRQYVANNITTALFTLKGIEVVEFQTKRRSKGTIITGGNDIKKLFTNFVSDQPKVVSLEFSQQYAKYLFDYGFIQYPKKIFTCKSTSAFDILEYIYRYYFLDKNHKTTFTITRGKILENVKSITSFEDVEKRFNRKYKQMIYAPFNNAIAYINENFEDLLEIEPIFTDAEKQAQDEYGIQEEDNIVNKEAWSSRKLKITLFDAPNYGTKQAKSRAKASKPKKKK